MTVYDALKKNLLLLMKLKKAGVISINPIYNLKVYEDYLALKGSKAEKYELIAAARGVAEVTVRRIINKLKKQL